MRKILKLTGVGEVLTKEAQEKLDKENTTVVFEDLTCENGKKRSWYEDMGMNVPKDLIEKEKNFENGIELEDEDYESLETPLRIYEDEIVAYVTSEDTTLIFTRTGITFTVRETVEDIDRLIENNNN